jgi:hypothetical protein
LIMVGEWWRLITPMFLVQHWELGLCFHSTYISCTIYITLTITSEKNEHTPSVQLVLYWPPMKISIILQLFLTCG